MKEEEEEEEENNIYFVYNHLYIPFIPFLNLNHVIYMYRASTAILNYSSNYWLTSLPEAAVLVPPVLIPAAETPIFLCKIE